MDIGVKVGMGGFVLVLIGLLVVYHAWFMPPPARLDETDASATTQTTRNGQS